MPNPLRVCVLGPMRAWVGEREIDLGPGRQRAIFAVLAAHAGRPVGRDELITAVWGDAPPATAAGSVYTYVSGLRRELEPGMLSSASGGYLLRVAPDDLDSSRFQRLRAAAAELLAAGRGRDAAARLDEALALWRGDAYATLAGPFLELDRQRLAELRLAAAEQRARVLLDYGGDDGLVAELTGLVKDNPLHEPLHELLMRALHRAGRHAEALDVFRTARRTLVSELGIEPGPALRELQRQVLAGSAERPAAIAVPEPSRTVVPTAIANVLRDGLGQLSPEARKVLRLAALLGFEFSVSEVVAVTGRSALELVGTLEEALTANVLVDSGTDLAFRHAHLRQALVESVPPALRAGLHRHTAEVLAAGGSPVTRVAEQLTAQTPVVDTWVLNWLVAHHAEVIRRAPQIAGDLIRRTLATDLPSAAQRGVLLVALVRLEFRRDRYPMTEAEEAMSLAADPAGRAEMRQLLATMRYRRGAPAEAVAMLRDAVDDPRVPTIWRSRHRVLLANFRRGELDDLDLAERRAREVLAEAVAAGQPYETAAALQTIWLTSSIGRDHERALEHVDRALAVVRDHDELAGTYFDLLDNRLFSLQNLDRLDEAQRTLQAAAAFAAKHRLAASLQVATAVQDYWLGRWDQALAEVSAVTEDGPAITFHGLREPGAVTMLLHGVAALIALHRDAPDLAAAHLGAADAAPASEAERENCDFLLVARSLAAEQRGRGAEALELLAPLLQPAYAPMMLRHQWLPDVLRLARAQSRPDIADRAAAICAAEAAKEVRPARAYAAHLRCQALLHGDPRPALAAAEHYRSVGRVFERAAALEDTALLSGAHPEEARRLYASMAARWDVARTSTVAT